MRWVARWGFVMVVALVATFGPVTLANGVSKNVSFVDATVTAAKANGNSAVSLTIHNNLSSSISLTSVSSTSSSSSMIDFADNMCQGGTNMTELANLLISPHRTQVLGYTYQGAMLSNLHGPFIKGHTVALTIKWTDFHSSHTVTLFAKVVAAPKGLHFSMQGMRM